MLVTGQMYAASGFRVDGGQASFMVESAGSPEPQVVRVDADQISEVRHTGRGKGALQGLLIGAVSGALFGAALGATTTTDNCSGDALCGLSRSDWAGIGAIVFTPPGMLVGALVGASRGATKTYRLERPGSGVLRPGY